MVDKTMKELQAHGTPGMPIASYEWFGNDFNNMELECHWHKEWELFTVIEGRAYFTINGERTEIGIGDVAFIQGGELHMSKAIDNEPFRYKALVFSPSLLHLPSDEMLEAKYIRPLLEGKYRLPVVLTKAKNGGAPLKLFDRIFKEVHERRPFYELRCKAGLFEILAYWLENSEQEQDAVKAGEAVSGNVVRMKNVLKYINENYTKNITIKQLSDYVNMSEGYFTRLFRRFISNSPMDYIIKLRLAKASELLCETDEKLINIALDTGFNNLSYFIRVFKANFSCSPTEYRRERKAS